MRKNKSSLFPLYLCFCIFFIASCKSENKHIDSMNNENGEKVHDDIPAKDIRSVIIRGNATSIVVRQSTNTFFEFRNEDLNKNHTYEVHSNVIDDTLDLHVMMEQDDVDHNVLGSFVLYIPRKEFEKIETTGDFDQIHFDTMQSDVFIHANKSLVVLDVESDQLNHDITLDALESSAFRSVSVYFDKDPNHIKLDLSLMQNGILNDEKNIFQKNKYETSTEHPVIRINNANEINVYVKE